MKSHSFDQWKQPKTWLGIGGLLIFIALLWKILLTIGLFITITVILWYYYQSKKEVKEKEDDYRHRDRIK